MTPFGFQLFLPVAALLRLFNGNRKVAVMSRRNVGGKLDLIRTAILIGASFSYRVVWTMTRLGLLS